MAAQGPGEKVCETVTCPICLEYFKDPVTLGCEHNFCQACLIQCWGGSGTTASCPLCRKINQQNFRPNRLLTIFVECVKEIQEGKKTEGKQGMCETHQEPLKLFCNDDQAPICMVCGSSKEHQGHSVLPIEETTQQECKASWTYEGTHSVTSPYLKMNKPEQAEHCQKTGLESQDLSVEELKITSIHSPSQPELEMEKLKAKESQPQPLELVHTRAPKDVFQAAEAADQLKLSQEDSERRTLQSEKDCGQGLPTGGRVETLTKSEKDPLPAEQKGAQMLPSPSPFKEKTCDSSGETGNLKSSCSKMASSASKRVHLVTAFKVGEDTFRTGPYRVPVFIKDQLVIGLLSTGSTVSVVRSDLVSPSDIIPGESFLISLLWGSPSSYPVARLPMEWGGWRGQVEMGVAKTLFEDVIIGMDLISLNPQGFPFSSAFPFALSQESERSGSSPDQESLPKRRGRPRKASSGAGAQPAPKAEGGASH